MNKQIEQTKERLGRYVEKRSLQEIVRKQIKEVTKKKK